MADTNNSISNKYLEEERACRQQIELLLTQSYYMLVAAVFTILFLSFFVHRKRLRPYCCQGRPGVLQPVNLLDDIHRRWMYVACFIILAEAIALQTPYLYYWNIGKDSDWTLKFSWISVLLQMIMMTHFCIVYYPLFACVAYRKSIIANVVGCVYITPLLVVECIVFSRCSVNENLASIHQIRIWYILWHIPSFISHVVYLCGSTFELVRNIRTRPAAITTSFGEVCREHEHYFTYVRHLLRRKRMNTETEKAPIPSSTVGRWKQRVVGFLKSLKYENVPGFRYSTAVLTATSVSIILVCLDVIVLSWFVESLYQFLHGIFIKLTASSEGIRAKLTADTASIILTFLDTVLNVGDDYLYIIRVVFHVTNVIAGGLQLAFNGHMLVRYRRNVLLMYRGNHDWHHKLKLSPAELMVGSMNYPSYHIVYSSVGWLVSMIVLFIVVFLIAVLILVPIRNHNINAGVIQQIIFIWPTFVILIGISIAHYLLCRLVFLQNPSTLAIENRRLYFVASYFTFLINIFVGIFSALRRFLIGIFLGSFMIGRLDYVLTMREFENYDGAHLAYLSMLTVEVTQNHPIVRTFNELLRRGRSVECMDGTNTYTADVIRPRTAKKSQRIRNKWYKMVTLINNPSIVEEKLKQSRIESINIRRQRPDHVRGQDASHGEASPPVSTIARFQRYHHLNDKHEHDVQRY